MDRGPTLAATPADTDDVRCEQAVFTSVRSPTGTGYRLIAASAGLTADEKREIVASAPSHGSLGDPSPTATAVASFPLSSGRCCVLLSRHAGAEPTGRGGLRVETHVLVLEPGAYQRFACDPLRVWAARDTAPVPPVPTRQSSIPLLTLPCPLTKPDQCDRRARPSGPTAPTDPATAERLAGILAAVLEQSRLVAVVPEPQAALACLLAATPAIVRARLSLSCGLGFAPARSFDLVLVDGLTADKRGLAEEHGLRVATWESVSLPAAGVFAAWLRFARDYWTAGRTTELDAAAAELIETAAPEALAQLAALRTDADRLARAPAEEWAALARRHAGAVPLSGAYARQRERLLAELDARRAVGNVADSTDGAPTG